MLVTGGAGFIGSHVVHALLAAGRDVRVLDDFSTGSWANLAAAEAGAAGGAVCEVSRADVRDDLAVREAVAGCAAIVHLGAIASVNRSLEDPVGTGSVTHGGTVNVVRRAVAARVPRLVLASSAAVYGAAARLPLGEDAPTGPLSPYAVAKLAAEETCAAAAAAGQLTAAALRFFNVYGPRQDPRSDYSGVISCFLQAALSGAPVTIHGDGAQTRDFVYVTDVTAAVVAALSATDDWQVFTIGSGVETSLLDVVATLAALCDAPLERRFGPPRPGDIRHSVADAGRAAAVLNWRARVPLRDGLAATLAWHTRHAVLAGSLRG